MLCGDFMMGKHEARGPEVEVKDMERWRLAGFRAVFEDFNQKGVGSSSLFLHLY